MLGSSQGTIPKSAIKYTQLTPESEWKQGCLKIELPKHVRRKVLGLIVVVAICFVIVIYSCVNCNLSCSGMCEVLGQTPSHPSDNLSHDFSNVSQPHVGPYEQRLPHCIIIGVRKAGTRALLTYLNTHPDIVQRTKETHFFDRDESYVEGLEYYRSLMPFSYQDQITVEKTPAYFVETLAPERIYRMNSSIRLVLIVRDPVTRLISDYEQLTLKAASHKRVPLENLVIDENGEVNVHYKPVQISMYYKFFPKWTEFFDSSQIHVVDGDSFIQNPYPLLYEVESFLGLGHKIPAEDFYYNETKGFYCYKGFDMPCLGASKGRPHHDVNEEVIDELRNFFRPRNRLFYAMVNQSFEWP